MSHLLLCCATNEISKANFSEAEYFCNRDNSTHSHSNFHTLLTCIQIINPEVFIAPYTGRGEALSSAERVMSLLIKFFSQQFLTLHLNQLYKKVFQLSHIDWLLKMQKVMWIDGFRKILNLFQRKCIIHLFYH